MPKKPWLGSLGSTTRCRRQVSRWPTIAGTWAVGHPQETETGLSSAPALTPRFRHAYMTLVLHRCYINPFFTQNRRIANCRKSLCLNKSGRLDLNQRPLGPEPSALARLSYAPRRQILIGSSLLESPPKLARVSSGLRKLKSLHKATNRRSGEVQHQVYLNRG